MGFDDRLLRRAPQRGAIDRINQLPGDLLRCFRSPQEDLVLAEIGDQVDRRAEIGEHLGQHWFDLGSRLVLQPVGLVLPSRVRLGDGRVAERQNQYDARPDAPAEGEARTDWWSQCFIHWSGPRVGLDQM